MVDSVKGAGGLQNPYPVKTAAPKSPSEKTGAAAAPTAKKDEVTISEKALSLQQAEETARQTGSYLQNSSLTLGSRTGISDVSS